MQKGTTSKITKSAIICATLSLLYSSESVEKDNIKVSPASTLSHQLLQDLKEQKIEPYMAFSTGSPQASQPANSPSQDDELYCFNNCSPIAMQCFSQVAANITSDLIFAGIRLILRI